MLRIFAQRPGPVLITTDEISYSDCLDWVNKIGKKNHESGAGGRLANL